MFSYHGECAGHNPSFTEKLVCLRCIQRFWVHVDLYFHLLCSHKHQNQRRSLGLNLVIIWPVNLQGMLLSSKCSFFARNVTKAFSIVSFSRHLILGHCSEVSKPASRILLVGESPCHLFKIRLLTLMFLWGVERLPNQSNVLWRFHCGICGFHLLPQALTTKSFGYFSESLGLCDSSGGFEGAS